MAGRETLSLYLGGEGGALMFEIGFEWWRGAAQVLVYAGVVLVILWIMSKIELPDRGESPIERERGSE